jgi:16S rRNA (guanine527-N7)-methyltransferase
VQLARIAELLAPFLAPAEDASEAASTALTACDLNLISTYIDLLLRWNARINLTAIRNEEEIVTRHFGESLFAARQLFPDASRRDVRTSVADVGSGAGFPGIPIKLWAPGIALTLIESNHKKAAFLREVGRALTLTNIDIQNVRAENLDRTFDVVTFRAVERFADILPVAARLVASSGRLVLLISRAQVEQAYTVLAELSWEEPIPVPESEIRVLLVAKCI